VALRLPAFVFDIHFGYDRARSYSGSQFVSNVNQTTMKKMLMVIPLLLLGVVLSVSPVRAQNGSETTITPLIDMPVWIPCANDGAGEWVLLNGNLHTVWHYSVNKNGGYTMFSSTNPQGVSGIGEITGLKYQGTGGTRDKTTVNAGQQFTYINNFRIIGQGPGNNYVVHAVYHFTINANGEITAEVDQFFSDCK
jgi:hypothetical protein